MNRSPNLHFNKNLCLTHCSIIFLLFLFIFWYSTLRISTLQNNKGFRSLSNQNRSFIFELLVCSILSSWVLLCVNNSMKDDCFHTIVKADNKKIIFDGMKKVDWRKKCYFVRHHAGKDENWRWFLQKLKIFSIAFKTKAHKTWIERLCIWEIPKESFS